MTLSVCTQCRRWINSSGKSSLLHSEKNSRYYNKKGGPDWQIKNVFFYCIEQSICFYLKCCFLKLNNFCCVSIFPIVNMSVNFKYGCLVSIYLSVSLSLSFLLCHLLRFYIHLSVWTCLFLFSFQLLSSILYE